jgi:alkylhydroperoxidase/carboxymuconolactone decarboxylase family protein YurZ
MTSNSKIVTTTTTDRPRETGPWDSALVQLQKWDPDWAETCLTMTTNPWTCGVLSRKFVELIGVAINVSCTNLNPEGTRRHIRAALHEGATRDEILMVLKMASILSIHSCALGGPIVLEEASEASLDAAGIGRAKRLKKAGERTPAIDKMKALKQWNDSWDPLVALTPIWADQFMAADVAIYTSGVFSTKEIELISIALDASYTHMYAFGTRRHIKAALKAGAAVEEIMEVLKLCVVHGVQSCNLGVPILAEELTQT